MAQKLAFVNNKGGSAKTTTAVNLAGAIHVRYPEKKILIFEVDGQGNATRSFGKNPNKYNPSAENVYLGTAPAEKAVVTGIVPNIDLIPGNNDLNFLEFDKMQEAEDELPKSTEKTVNTLKDDLKKKIIAASKLSKSELLNLIDSSFSKEKVDSLVKKEQFFPSKNYFNMLKDQITDIDKKYDFIIFDTPPELKAVTSSVLAVADKVIIPYEPDSYSVDGIQNIIKRIRTIQKDYNNNLEIGGLLATKYRNNVNVHRDTVLLVTDFANKIGIPFFSTRIPHTVSFINAITLYSKPATLSYDRASAQKKKFIKYYFDLLDEMIQKGVITV